jgi:hypothetical protein
MFSFFKRSDKESAAVANRPRTQAKRPVKNLGLDGREVLPLPQVTEGNEDSDWAMWEDSVLEQDSQMHSQFHDTVPSEFPIGAHAESTPDADPFSNVSKHAA